LQFQPSWHGNQGEEDSVSTETEKTDLDLADWRNKIDVLDEQIVKLISERAKAADAIGELKHKHAMPVYEPKREQSVIDHVRAVNQGPLPDQEIQHIYERIMDVMRTLQRKG
jgi:chorismate mutase